jgi:ectoine hydroxylase-related dioxygenase (phytanoyl-CoA dioxygenase family)
MYGSDGSSGPLGPELLRRFEADGYLLFKGFLDAEEVALLMAAAHEDRSLLQNAYGVRDASGRQTRLSSWNHPSDDIFGALSRSRRIVDAVEQLLGGEVYHYHSKLMLKEPRVGGAWEWHQDYGYWYQNGCLLPDLASCMIALDPATRENGCLQVLRGSQRMGRIEHGRAGNQTGADPERVGIALQRFELVHIELEPGDALMFHSNLLHASGPNLSERPRWSIICCYNAAHNDPYKDSHHPRYTKLHKLPHEALRSAPRTPIRGRDFVDPAHDQTIAH